MPPPKLTRLELQIMEALWELGACSIREIQQAFPDVPEQELSKAQSNPDQLVSTIEQKTGQSKDQIEQKLTQLVSRV